MSYDITVLPNLGFISETNTHEFSFSQSSWTSQTRKYMCPDQNRWIKNNAQTAETNLGIAAF